MDRRQPAVLMIAFLKATRSAINGGSHSSLLDAIYLVRATHPINDMYASIRALNERIAKDCLDFNPHRLTMCGIGLHWWSKERARADVLQLLDSTISALDKGVST